MNVMEKEIEIKNPNIDDSIKPDFKVLWIVEPSGERGSSIFFTYEYGIEIVEAVFYLMYLIAKFYRFTFCKYVDNNICTCFFIFIIFNVAFFIASDRLRSGAKVTQKE